MKVKDTFDLNSLEWSNPVEVQTKNGLRHLQKAEPTEDFWGAWKSSKELLRGAGISLSKDRVTQKWEVCWWRIDVEGNERRAKVEEASRAEDADIDIPCPEGLAYLGYQKAGILYALRVFGDIE
jgi:hypothetical protein